MALELVLDRAHELLEDVLHREDPDGLPLLVDDDHQVRSPFLEFAQGGLERHPVLERQDRAHEPPDVGRGGLIDPPAPQVLDVEDAGGPRRVLRIDEEPGARRLLQGRGNPLPSVGETDPLGPVDRDHGVGDLELPEVEEVLEEEEPPERQGAPLLREAQDEPELLLGVVPLPAVRHVDPQEPQDPVLSGVQHRHRGVEDLPEEVEGPGDPQGRLLRSPDRHGLRDELPEEDVEEGDQEERQSHRDRVGDGRPPEGLPGEKRADEPRERRFPQPPEPQARDGDPQLADGKIRVELFHDPLRELRPPVPGRGELRQARRAHLDDRELRQDEEGVQGQEERRQEQVDDSHRGTIRGAPKITTGRGGKMKG